MLTFLPRYLCVWVTQYCLSLCHPMDCIPPGSSLHGIFQARIVEWVVIPISRRSSPSRDQTWVSCIAGRFFTVWAIREAPLGTYLATFYKSDVLKFIFLRKRERDKHFSVNTGLSPEMMVFPWQPGPLADGLMARPPSCLCDLLWLAGLTPCFL